MASEASQLSAEDFEKLIFYEAAKDQALREYKKNNKDVNACLRLGGAMIELSHYKSGAEAIQSMEEGMKKIEEALAIDPKKHEALWCLGNALTSKGFLEADSKEAQKYFDQAEDYFKKAVKEDPNNEVYKKALEMNATAPSWHAKIQTQIQEQRQKAQEAEKAEQSKLAAQNTDYLYDVAGWVILVGLGFGFVLYNKLATATK